MCAHLWCGFYALESGLFRDLWWFQPAQASVTSTVQASRVINLIKEPHMDAHIHRQETREWWEYFTACLSFNLSQWRGGGGIWGYLSRVSAGPGMVWRSAEIQQLGVRLCLQNKMNITQASVAPPPLSLFQVPRARTRVWRRAVWLPGKERQVNA